MVVLAGYSASGSRINIAMAVQGRIGLLSAMALTIAAGSDASCDEGDAVCKMHASYTAETDAMKVSLLQFRKSDPNTENVTDESMPTRGGGCCDKCVGRYCSPMSWNCYMDKHKPYYEKCPAPRTAAGAPSMSCCYLCPGKFCSQLSGTCYDEAAREDYKWCPKFDYSCCRNCPNCWRSPKSGNCYDTPTKQKDYYESCSVLFGQAADPAPSCCDRCRSNFCSPKSGNCYDQQNKLYYKSCHDVHTSRQLPDQESWRLPEGWELHPHTNCYPGNGAQPPIEGPLDLSPDECLKHVQRSRNMHCFVYFFRDGGKCLPRKNCFPIWGECELGTQGEESWDFATVTEKFS
eukprot:TRINITY_DN102862_c0_g1_i1.p1 TRINITY_DN102862_c0_g1~~TRINITY_DN102862_c0_g1_i1.p1  ORF type:complete len:347 (-),score=16.76 TRINITY_DN102862_c0_g1_i1:146-1186(-)